MFQYKTLKLTYRTTQVLLLFFFLLSMVQMAYIFSRPMPMPAEIPEKEIITDFKGITLAKVMGKVDFEKDSSFIEVNPNYTNKKTFLEKETYNAFLKMRAAALKEGITMTIVSGGRDFYHQKRIWEGKWKRYEAEEPIKRILKIMEYSSMPGTSRHHWGTDIDINNLNNSYFEKGEGLVLYQWLCAHAEEFGFYQTYTNKYTTDRHSGYNEEKWHWSYFPLSTKYLQFYKKNIGYEDISGFSGSKLAIKVGAIERYVQGVAKPPNTEAVK